MTESPTRVVVAAFYRFAVFTDFESFREPLQNLMVEEGIKGTLLLAAEGINGTIAGSREGIDAVIGWLAKDGRFSGLEVKESYVTGNPFYRSKVKLKKEIVTMGMEGINPNNIVGTYVDPRDWNALISDPEVLLLDTRNDYEVEIGTFENAVNPDTTTFRQFPDYVSKELSPKKQKKVAMFCTGGIRCEKSTAYLKQQGFEEVFHLKGGILNYLEKVPEDESMWQGECFVFDNRVTVNHKLEQGDYDQCHACRLPITEEDKQHLHYQKGVSCHRCYGKHSDEQIKRYADRERQINLAKERGEEHIGSSMKTKVLSRKREKLALKEKQRSGVESRNK
tara:strand:- start:22990 stop:23997 length:1008 start_codon:yes stop_codon:yes gene_type:complete